MLVLTPNGILDTSMNESETPSLAWTSTGAAEVDWHSAHASANSTGSGCEFQGFSQGIRRPYDDYDGGIILPKRRPPSGQSFGGGRGSVACQPPPIAWINAIAAAWRLDINCDRFWRAESAVTCAVTTVV